MNATRSPAIAAGPKIDSGHWTLTGAAPGA